MYDNITAYEEFIDVLQAYRDELDYSAETYGPSHEYTLQANAALHDFCDRYRHFWNTPEFKNAEYAGIRQGFALKPIEALPQTPIKY